MQMVTRRSIICEGSSALKTLLHGMADLHLLAKALSQSQCRTRFARVAVSLLKTLDLTTYTRVSRKNPLCKVEPEAICYLYFLTLSVGYTTYNLIKRT